MRKGYNKMKKEIYYTPNLWVFNTECEDVICSSGDNDVPFLTNVTNNDVFS